MKRALLLTCFALATVFAACDVTTDSVAIPAPFQDRIAKLRDDNIQLAKKCSDLQRQMAELQAQSSWNAAQANLAGTEAMASLHLSPSEWLVDVDKMRILKRKH